MSQYPFLTDFLTNRELQDYIDVIDELFYNYASSNDFAGRSPQSRAKIADCVSELKQLINNLNIMCNNKKKGRGTQVIEKANSSVN